MANFLSAMRTSCRKFATFCRRWLMQGKFRVSKKVHAKGKFVIVYVTDGI